MRELKFLRSEVRELRGEVKELRKMLGGMRPMPMPRPGGPGGGDPKRDRFDGKPRVTPKLQLAPGNALPKADKPVRQTPKLKEYRPPVDDSAAIQPIPSALPSDTPQLLDPSDATPTPVQPVESLPSIGLIEPQPFE